MITLTAAIAVPNIQRVKISEVLFFDASSAAVVKGAVLSSPANNRSKLFELTIKNGLCDVLGPNPTPTRFDEDLVVSYQAITVAAGYDNLEAAYRGGANKAAAFRAVESRGIADAWLVLVGAVS